MAFGYGVSRIDFPAVPEASGQTAISILLLL